jgi:hypothetical protein
MKTRFFFIFIMCACLNSQAQMQILFQSDQTKSYLLSYANSNEVSQQVINEILDAIAKVIPKPVYQTKISFNIDENIKITRDKNLVSIYVDHQNFVLSGDVLYKGFDMTDVLVPSKYEFTADLRRIDGTAIAGFLQPKTDFTPAFSEVILQYIDSLPANAYNFVINLTKFYYDDAARNRFRDKAMLIDQYFSADIDLNNMSKQLSGIDPKAFEEVEKTQITLNSIKSMLDNISNAVFWQVLHIETYDPLKLNFKLIEVRNAFSEIQDQLSQTKSALPRLYYDKALKLYNDKKIQDAKTAFEKSLGYNSSFAPSQYYLARIAFETNKTDEAKQQIHKLYAIRDIDDMTRKAAHALAGSIEWVDMNMAARLLTGGEYAEALSAVDNAETFCKSIPSYTCNDTIELIRRDCHLGIYSADIKSSGNLLVQKKFQEAENEIDEAVRYQETFSKYIPDKSEALEMKQKIKIEEYDFLMTEGKEKMTAKDFRAAFTEFSNAKSIENDYPVRKDKLLPELLKKSKLEILMLDIDDAEKAVSSNSLTSARNILRHVIDEQRIYGLIDNSTLSSRIENLKISVFNQECTNAQNEYNAKIALATTAVNAASYIIAETYYQEASQIILANPDCGIKDDQMVTGLKNVEKPAQYQRLLGQCNDMVKNGSYAIAIESYNNLTSFYNNNSITKYNINHQPLHFYISSFESGFVSYGITWFIDAGELDQAMFLLKLLRQRNVVKSSTKVQQITLARAYAITDYKANNTLNAKLKVTEYTLGDKWYSYFTKEYLKQIKKFK